jgi:hypothetical protein
VTRALIESRRCEWLDSIRGSFAVLRSLSVDPAAQDDNLGSREWPGKQDSTSGSWRRDIVLPSSAAYLPTVVASVTSMRRPDLTS